MSSSLGGKYRCCQRSNEECRDREQAQEVTGGSQGAEIFIVCNHQSDSTALASKG